MITVSVANAGRKLQKSRKSPLFQIEGLLHNVMRAILD